jgi:hypothetical protein
LVSTFSDYDLSYDRLKKFSRPAYIAVAGFSNPVEMRKADILKSLRPNLQVEVYQDRSHFDPPQWEEPERFARALTSLWQRT